MTFIPPNLDRRGFIKGASGLAFSFALPGIAAPGETPFAPNIWMTIAPDGIVTIMSPAAEMGQGTLTALPVIVAEELDADWSKVRVEAAPLDAKKYGNPYYGGSLAYSSSMTVSAYFTPLRLAGARARRVLLDAVAARWSVPVAELTTEPSVVVHASSKRRMSYGEIASFAKAPETPPNVAEADLKPASAFRLIGTSVPRVDIPAKTRGAARYALDADVPNMAYGAVLQCPWDGGAPDTVDDAKARAMPGVVDIVKLPNGVGVIADAIERAQAAKNALVATWTSAPASQFDSERALDEFMLIARDKSQRGVEFAAQGDVDSGIAKAAKVMRSEFRTRHVYHAQMEPLNATAAVSADGKSAEIWCGTQSPSAVLNGVAQLLGSTPDKIVVHQQYLGGAYGRRSQIEVVLDAARLSLHAKRPVKLVWSREDDMKGGKFRPATAHFLEAGLDANDRITSWHHRVVAESVVAYTSPAARLEQLGGKDHILMKGSPVIPYNIENKRAEYVRQKRGIRLSPWRGVGVGHNLPAIEGFIDEIARAQGKDPLQLRLELTAKSERANTLLKTVAQMSDWNRKREGTALGVAMEEKDETLAAGVAEISLDRATGLIKVVNFWMAIDCGIAVQPFNIATQMEGGVIYGLGHVLREEITHENGRVKQSNFHDYRVMRMEDCPHIEVKVISTDNKPTGVGEDGVPLTGATVGNAFYALTGVRLRELPMTPSRVMAALSPGKTG
jgi:isoquinoline 1-oxidoreductase beta subunit